VRYTVEVAGKSVELRLEAGAGGVQLALGDDALEPARWVQISGALHSLEWGARRLLVLVEPDPLEPAGFRVSLPGKTPLPLQPMDERTLAAAAGRQANAPKGLGTLRSAMPGVIVEVRVEPGARVAAGEVILILEAMKMQNEIKAAGEGTVAQVHVSAGDSVPAGAKLVEFAPEE
jgi:glutaconyl-CoA/methylmalonyl-CoA decarboxylase subunit gamma